MYFWYLQFSQKTSKKIRLYYYGTSSWIDFVRFLGELKTPKRHFEINWPLNSATCRIIIEGMLMVHIYIFLCQTATFLQLEAIRMQIFFFEFFKQTFIHSRKIYAFHMEETILWCRSHWSEITDLILWVLLRVFQPKKNLFRQTKFRQPLTADVFLIDSFSNPKHLVKVWQTRDKNRMHGQENQLGTIHI